MKTPHLMEAVIVLAILFIVAAATINSCERITCKNGEDVRDNDGSMDCWGSDTFKHCEPSTHFVCHD
jgi:hypothetical protein